jgi:hypothetical protein
MPLRPMLMAGCNVLNPRLGFGAGKSADAGTGNERLGADKA